MHTLLFEEVDDVALVERELVGLGGRVRVERATLRVVGLGGLRLALLHGRLQRIDALRVQHVLVWRRIGVRSTTSGRFGLAWPRAVCDVVALDHLDAVFGAQAIELRPPRLILEVVGSIVDCTWSLQRKFSLVKKSMLIKIMYVAS